MTPDASRLDAVSRGSCRPLSGTNKLSIMRKTGRLQEGCLKAFVRSGAISEEKYGEKEEQALARLLPPSLRN